jgi:ABC-type dipeptide/oligopeptide/nickel transport system permease subunit
VSEVLGAGSGELETRSRERGAGADAARAVWRFVRREPFACLFGLLALFVCLLSAFAPLATHYSATAAVGEALEKSSSRHLLGTDDFGRDLFARVLYGGRISLAVGVIATVAGVAISLILGVNSAYAGGAVDYVLQRIVDVVQAVPAVVLLLAILVALGPSIPTIVFALALRGGIVGSRVMRAATLTLNDADFVTAARSLGGGRARIVLRHLMPNLIPLALVIGSVSLSANVIAEASISYLGFGIKPPNPSWGRMLADGRTYMLSAPILVVIPTIALALIVLGANLIGDALRDQLDPRLRSR